MVGSRILGTDAPRLSQLTLPPALKIDPRDGGDRKREKDTVKKNTVTNYLTMITDQNLTKTLTEYRLSEHSLAIEKGRHRKTWLPVEERLCNHCTTAESETELHFLTKMFKCKTSSAI